MIQRLQPSVRLNQADANICVVERYRTAAQEGRFEASALLRHRSPVGDHIRESAAAGY